MCLLTSPGLFRGLLAGDSTPSLTSGATKDTLRSLLLLANIAQPFQEALDQLPASDSPISDSNSDSNTGPGLGAWRSGATHDVQSGTGGGSDNAAKLMTGLIDILLPGVRQNGKPGSSSGDSGGDGGNGGAGGGGGGGSSFGSSVGGSVGGQAGSGGGKGGVSVAVVRSQTGPPPGMLADTPAPLQTMTGGQTSGQGSGQGLGLGSRWRAQGKVLGRRMILGQGSTTWQIEHSRQGRRTLLQATQGEAAAAASDTGAGLGSDAAGSDAAALVPSPPAVKTSTQVSVTGVGGLEALLMQLLQQMQQNGGGYSGSGSTRGASTSGVSVDSVSSSGVPGVPPSARTGISIPLNLPGTNGGSSGSDSSGSGAGADGLGLPTPADTAGLSRVPGPATPSPATATNVNPITIVASGAGTGAGAALGSAAAGAALGGGPLMQALLARFGGLGAGAGGAGAGGCPPCRCFG